MVRWVVVAVALAATVSLSGCSSGSDTKAATTTTSTAATGPTVQGSAAPECADIYAEGTTTNADAFDQECRADDGKLHIYGTAIDECTDGRKLAHNDVGWGYIGEPWHRHQPGAELVAPAAERETCDPG